MRWHPNPGLHLEMAFMKLIELAGLPRLESVLEQLESGRFQGAAGTPEKPPENRDLFGSSPAPRGPSPVAKTTAAPARPVPPAAPEPVRSEPVRHSQGFRERLLAAVQDKASLHSSLGYSTDIHIRDGNLIVVFPASERVHADLVQGKARRLSEISGKLTGSPCKLQVRRQETESAGEDEKRDLTEHPKVKAFLKRFPSKVIEVTNP